MLIAACCGGSAPPTNQPATRPLDTPTPLLTDTPLVSTSAPIPTPTAIPISPPTSTPVPTATPVPIPTATSASQTPARIFAAVSPSVAYIERETFHGSALLVDGGYLVTNAHVVWPSNGAKVVFPDGTVIRNVPLVGWDLLADLAVLGPVNSSAQPLKLSESAEPVIGAEVFAIGYPTAPGDPPQPTLSRGIVSRYRHWDATGLTYIQTDAAIEGGQSGGVLVSETGEIVGITGYTIGEANHSLSLASSDLAPRVRSLVSGNDSSGIGLRLIPQSGGDIRHLGSLGTFWDTKAFVIDEPVGTDLNIAVTSEDDVDFTVYDSAGEEVLYVDDLYSGSETGTAVVQYEEPYFLVVSQLTEDSVNFNLESSHELVPIPDHDDGQQIRIGQSLVGNIDYPGDIDTYTVRLSANQRVEFSVTSFLLDTFLLADFQGAYDDEIIVDDDSGGGLFGLDPKIVYSAPHTGTFFVVVSDNYNEVGGYVLEVSNASSLAQLTSTTRADYLDDSADGSTYTDGFGQYELRAALHSLPDSFVELDPEAEGVSAADLGLQDTFQNNAAFENSDPYQVILAFSGELTELERTALHSELSSPGVFLEALREGISEDVQSSRGRVGNYGLLRAQSVGDVSAGGWFDLVYEDGTLQADIIMFIREKVAGLIYSYSLPDSSTLVSSVEAALMLDEAIGAFVTAQ